LCTPYSGLPEPNTTYTARMMKPTIAPILMVENQYSNVPKVFTLIALSTINTLENETIHTHSGTLANQYFMYIATAVTSVPTASTIAAQ